MKQYPWLTISNGQREDYLQAVSKRFSQVHFEGGYRRVTIRDAVGSRPLYTPGDPNKIRLHRSGRLIYDRNAPWIAVNRRENSLLAKLMEFNLLFVEG